MTSNDTDLIIQESRPARRPLTARQQRRRVILLTLLLLLLAILGLATYFFLVNRSMPIPRIGRDGGGLTPPQYLYSITGSGASALKKPVGVDVADNGRVYVVDFGKRRISVFTARGRFLYAFNKTADGNLRNPVHLQIINDEVWVTDRRLRGIYIFDLEGKFKRAFKAKNEPDFKWTPLALSFAPDGSLRATDVGNTQLHRLVYFSKDGSRTATVGKTNQVTRVDASPGTFYFPNGLAVDKAGLVYVADGDNRRVQVFDKDGKFKRFIDTSGVPRGLAIDAKDRFYVVDALAHTVDVYDLDGERLTQFGTRGFGPGQFNFPNDVAVDDGNRIFVTDRENNQVQVWGWPAFIVPRNVAPTKPWQWALCLTPLLLLPFLLRNRKRRYVLTPEFVTAIAEVGRIEALRAPRVRLLAPEEDRERYDGIAVNDSELLSDLITFVEHSESDVAAMRDKLRCTEIEGIYLTLGDRARGILSESIDLRRLGLVARVGVYDVNEYLAEIGDKPSDQRKDVA